MTINDTDFETWFSCLQVNLLYAGIDFHDDHAVRGDYDQGRDMFDVVEEIVQEYE